MANNDFTQMAALLAAKQGELQQALATVDSLQLRFADAVQNQFSVAQKLAADADQLLLLKPRLAELPADTPAKTEITLQQRPQMSHVHSLLGSKV